MHAHCAHNTHFHSFVRIWPSAAQTIRSSRGQFTGPVAIASDAVALEGVCKRKTTKLVFTTSDRITIAHKSHLDDDDDDDDDSKKNGKNKLD